MNGRRVKDRRPARRSLVPAVALGLAVALGACSPAGPPEPSSGPTGAPVTVTHSNAPLQAAVAAVVERNLRRRGHAVAPQPEGAPAPAQPWDAAGGRTVAVVDTLTLVLTEDPASLLPSVPEPSPRPTTAPTAAGAASTSLPPLDPAAPPRVPADPTAAASPTPLPRGESAPDAAATRGIVEELLAAGGAVSSGVTPASGSSTAAAASAFPGVARPHVLSASREPLRLAAVVTATTATRLELDSLDDLNGRCEELRAATPAVLGGAEPGVAAVLLRERLDRLAGCRIGEWLSPAQEAIPAVVQDEAQVGLAYRFDPEIEASALVPLGDGERVLPEGSIAVLGDPDALDDDAEAAIREVMDGLDEEGLRQLARLTTGDDALSPEDAAQYWLVTRGLEEAPEDWFVPRGSWF